MRDFIFTLLGVLMGLTMGLMMLTTAHAADIESTVEDSEVMAAFETEEKDIEREVAASTFEVTNIETTAGQAPPQCEVPSDSCDHFTKAQEDCVVKKRCNKDIRKLLKQVRALEEENGKLKEKVAMLEAESRLEVELARIKNIEREPNPKNSISLLLGRTPTGLETKETSGKFNAETKAETDVGLMYQRDFGDESDFRGSIGITVRGAGYLGLGLNF